MAITPDLPRLYESSLKEVWGRGGEDGRDPVQIVVLVEISRLEAGRITIHR
jgi:hypothetical protein